VTTSDLFRLHSGHLQGGKINNIFIICTDMCPLTTGMPYNKCVVRRFCRCANVIECSDTNLDSIAYYTTRLYGIGYCFLGYNLVQHITVLNTVGNCNKMVSVIVLWNHRHICGTLLIETSLCGAYQYLNVFLVSHH
jgi:hypothetical protein